jgi:hypothetical protein
MKGIILHAENYIYIGDIVDDEPHGRGRFYYNNGAIYIGECYFGKPDGYGIYIYQENTAYQGFFSYGKFHGIGTFEDAANIYKGSWRADKKHGMFFRTNKEAQCTYVQKWVDDILISSKDSQYIAAEELKTTKQNPYMRRDKKSKIAYKGAERQCIICNENPANCTNAKCGHVILCYNCFSRCDNCPICRSPVSQLIKLYVS